MASHLPTTRSIPLLRATRHHRRRAYTLVEMLAVVLILGVLAALITYATNWIVARARLATFQANARTYTDAAELYRVREGHYPESPAPGVLPPKWEKYVDPDKWLASTPIGGQWHIGGNPVGLGVLHDFALDDKLDEEGEDEDVIQQSIVTDLEEYDQLVDDGNLETGSFQTAGGGFYRHVLGG